MITDLDSAIYYYDQKGFVFIPGLDVTIKRSLLSRRGDGEVSMHAVELYCMKPLSPLENGNVKIALIVRSRANSKTDTKRHVGHDVVEVPMNYRDKSTNTITSGAIGVIAESIGFMVTMLKMGTT